jgi:hypothetical protein
VTVRAGSYKRIRYVRCALSMASSCRHKSPTMLCLIMVIRSCFGLVNYNLSAKTTTIQRSSRSNAVDLNARLASMAGQLIPIIRVIESGGGRKGFQRLARRRASRRGAGRVVFSGR